MSRAWTKERVAALDTAAIRQLRANAANIGEDQIAALCDEALASRPRSSGARRTAVKRESRNGPQLVSRGKAFEMRGVKLHNPRWSWGGIRQADGTVVFTVWAKDIGAAGDTRKYMLFGPDRGGQRPWSDTPGGKERLRHCQLALSAGEAEGVLIYGERRGEDLPLDEVSRVSGADPHTVLRFRVVQEGDEFWAVWNVKAG